LYVFAIFFAIFLVVGKAVVANIPWAFIRCHFTTYAT